MYDITRRGRHVDIPLDEVIQLADEYPRILQPRNTRRASFLEGTSWGRCFGVSLICISLGICFMLTSGILGVELFWWPQSKWLGGGGFPTPEILVNVMVTGEVTSSIHSFFPVCCVSLMASIVCTCSVFEVDLSRGVHGLWLAEVELSPRAFEPSHGGWLRIKSA